MQCAFPSVTDPPIKRTFLFEPPGGLFYFNVTPVRIQTANKGLRRELYGGVAKIFSRYQCWPAPGSLKSMMSV
jgi:hypothetical protein